MKLVDLTHCWVYKKNSINIDGQIQNSWEYKTDVWINIQQDISDLDRNSVGEIDYTQLKGRTVYDLDLKVGDGISFLEMTDDQKVNIEYIITSSQKVGPAKIYTLATYTEEDNLW